MPAVILRPSRVRLRVRLSDYADRATATPSVAVVSGSDPAPPAGSSPSWLAAAWVAGQRCQVAQLVTPLDTATLPTGPATVFLRVLDGAEDILLDAGIVVLQ